MIPRCHVCGTDRFISFLHMDHWEHLCGHCWIWGAAASLMKGPTWGETRECPNLAQKQNFTLQELNSYLWDAHNKNQSRAINEGKIGADFIFSPELVDPEDPEEP